jgi:hypothetical protein
MEYLKIDTEDYNYKNKMSLMIFGVEYEKLMFKSDDFEDLRCSNIMGFNKQSNIDY